MKKSVEVYNDISEKKNEKDNVLSPLEALIRTLDSMDFNVHLAAQNPDFPYQNTDGVPEEMWIELRYNDSK